MRYRIDSFLNLMCRLEIQMVFLSRILEGIKEVQVL